MNKIILPNNGVIGKTVNNPIKILCGMPIGRPMEMEPLDSWTEFRSYMSANPKYIASGKHCRGAYIDHNRDIIAQTAISANADYVLMIDSDMVYPYTVADSLIAVDKDVVGVKYMGLNHDNKNKTVEIRPMIFDYDTKKRRFDAWPKCDDKKPFRVNAVGTGIMLIKTKVFKKYKKPWFPFLERRGEVWGEDMGFCLHCMAHNIEVWVEPTVRVGHCKTYTFYEEDCTVK